MKYTLMENLEATNLLLITSKITKSWQLPHKDEEKIFLLFLKPCNKDHYLQQARLKVDTGRKVSLKILNSINAEELAEEKTAAKKRVWYNEKYKNEQV